MPAIPLTPDERRELTATVGGLYDFTDMGARGRRVLIEQANLSRFLPGLDLTGDPRTVAGDLIGRLAKFGPFPEQPTYHALGALLSYVLTLGDLPEARAYFLAGVIVKYALVGDSAYIDMLQDTYTIARAVPIVPAQPIAPVPPAVASAFEVSKHAAEVLEQVINSKDNFLGLYVLMGAIYSSQAVCQIELPGDRPVGTGFLIGPNLLLTNHHVLKNQTYLEQAIARFDYARLIS